MLIPRNRSQWCGSVSDYRKESMTILMNNLENIRNYFHSKHMFFGYWGYKKSKKKFSDLRNAFAASPAHHYQRAFCRIIWKIWKIIHFQEIKIIFTIKIFYVMQLLKGSYSKIEANDTDPYHNVYTKIQQFWRMIRKIGNYL